MRPASWDCFSASRRLAALGTLLFALLGCTGLGPSSDGRLVEPVVTGLQMSEAAEPAQLAPQWVAAAEVVRPARSHAGLLGPTVWVRFEFDLPASWPAAASWAVYIPYLYNGGRLWLNGAPLAAIARTDDELHVVWIRPHLIPIPDAQLRSGRNVLLLRAVSTDAGSGMWSRRLTIGPGPLLQPQHDTRMFWARTMAQTTVIFCLLVGVAMAYVWWRQPGERLYGLFGLMTLLWGLRTLIFVFEVLPASWWPGWLLLHHASSGGFVIVLALFTMRFAALDWPWFERALWAYGLLGPLALLIGGRQFDEWVNLIWSGGMLPIGAAIVGFAAWAAWRQRSGASIALLVALVLTAAAGLHDHLVAWDGSFDLPPVLAGWFEHRVFVLHLAAAILLLVMVGILTQRFVRVLDSAEKLNRRLEERVSARERELAARQAELTRLTHEQATAQERQRIMQDLHDGLGSRLFTTLSRYERGDLSPRDIALSLRQCIADMRLTFEVISPAEIDLASAFSDFRYRWDGLLRDAGVSAVWYVDLPADGPTPAATEALQLLHIAQEALTNVLKHAQASQVRVVLVGSAHGLELSVTDNGRGVTSDEPAAGARGLANMRRRARQLGGHLAFESRAGRTDVRVSFGPSAAADAQA